MKERTQSLLGILASVVLLTVLIYSVTDKDTINLNTMPAVIVDVERIPPGKLNTLQFDPVYIYRLDINPSVQHRTQKRVKVGDTMYLCVSKN